MLEKNAVTVIALIIVAGCSGGGGDRSFADAEREAIELAATLEDLEISSVAQLPTSGSAAYEGMIGVAVPGYAVLGDLNVNVNFASESITGNAGNFIDSDDERISGSLAIDNGSFIRNADPLTEFQFTADIGGALSDSDGNYLVDGQLLGDFLGQNQEGMSGLVVGTISSPTLGTASISEDNSGFGALRQ